jgi:hypothetical protein
MSERLGKINNPLSTISEAAISRDINSHCDFRNLRKKCECGGFEKSSHSHRIRIVKIYFAFFASLSDIIFNVRNTRKNEFEQKILFVTLFLI